MIKFKVKGSAVKRSGQHIPTFKSHFINAVLDKIRFDMYIDMDRELIRLDFDNPNCSYKPEYEIEVIVKFKIKRKNINTKKNMED